ncbi:MAG: hypothetical protein FWF55_05750 [Treponema sp.]|nr:hypothetical protein [Treponema sp.]
MRRALFFLLCLFFTAFAFAQHNSGFTVIGEVPHAGDTRLFQIQVGAYQDNQNAEKAFRILYNASLYPAYERFDRFTRVVINGIAARDVPAYLYHIQQTGFNEVIIREVIIRIDNNREAAQPPVYSAPVKPPVIEISIYPFNNPVIKEAPAPAVPVPEEAPAPPAPAPVPEDAPVPSAPVPEDTPAPFAPAQQAVPVREPAPRPQQPLPLLPAPENRYPQDGYEIGAEELRRQRSIDLSWDAVQGATAYIVTIYHETPQGREQIFITEPLRQTNYTLDNMELFENTETYVWRVEALAYNSQGTITQRGRPGDNAYTFTIPQLGRVRIKDIGILYGNNDDD